MLTKDEISKQMVQFFLDHLFVLFLITMGGGKTKGALDCVITKYGYKRKGMIVCHSAKSRDNTWPDEITLWHPQLQIAINKGFVKIIHRNDLLKLPADWYDWIIWDEVHTAKEEHIQWLRIYKDYIKSVILMTGTETGNHVMANRVRKYVNQMVLEFPTETAIDQELINDYRVKTIEIPLSATDLEAYLEIGRKLTIARNSSNAQWLESLINQRYRFIIDNPGKIEIIKQLDVLVNDKRRLLFMSTKDACAQVSEHIFHSSTKETDFILFARGDIDKLASIRQLKTGTNIKGFDHILCQQINSKYEDFMQTLGRLLRLEIGQIGWIYVLYFKDTQDQSWFDKAGVKVPAHKKRIYDITQTPLEEIVLDTF
jgi:superfamily II DNA or RNA helicase